MKDKYPEAERPLSTRSFPKYNSIREEGGPVKAMEQPRYYYSVDGTATRGPVDFDAVRRLCEQRILTDSSLICEEGATQWQKLDPQAFAPSLARPARSAPAQAPRLKNASALRSPRALKYSFGGIDRLTFLGFYIISVVASCYWSFTHPIPPKDIFGVPFLIQFSLIFAVHLLLIALRLQNVGNSPWLCLLVFVPFLNLGITVYALFAAPGSAAQGSGCLTTALLTSVVVTILATIVLVWAFKDLTAHFHGKLPPGVPLHHH